MSSYLTNTQLRARGYDACAPGFELSPTRDGGLTVSFWHGFFKGGQILDRVNGERAQRQTVARITPREGGFSYKTMPGPKGAIRYGWAKTEQEAEAAVAKWVKRRFAHVTALYPR